MLQLSRRLPWTPHKEDPPQGSGLANTAIRSALSHGLAACARWQSYAQILALGNVHRYESTEIERAITGCYGDGPGGSISADEHKTRGAWTANQGLSVGYRYSIPKTMKAIG